MMQGAWRAQREIVCRGGPGKAPPAAEASEQSPGLVQYTEVGSGITHSVKNVGDGDDREILVELKGPSRAATATEPETNE